MEFDHLTVVCFLFVAMLFVISGLVIFLVARTKRLLILQEEISEMGLQLVEKRHALRCLRADFNELLGGVQKMQGKKPSVAYAPTRTLEEAADYFVRKYHAIDVMCGDQ